MAVEFKNSNYKTVEIKKFSESSLKLEQLIINKLLVN